MSSRCTVASLQLPYVVASGRSRLARRARAGGSRPSGRAPPGGAAASGPIHGRPRRAAVCSASEMTVQAEDDRHGAGPSVKVHWHGGDSGDGWGLHVWGAARDHTAWDAPLLPCEEDEFGLVWRVPVLTWVIGQNGLPLHLLVHAGERKDIETCVPENKVVETFGDASELEVWMVAGINKVFYEKPDLAALPVGDLGKACAHWVSRDLLAWRTGTGGAEVSLHFSGAAALESKGGKLINGDSEGFRLAEVAEGLPDAVLAKLPFLRGAACFRVPPEVDPAHLATCQVVAAKTSAETGTLLDCTGVQLQGLLDDLFAYDGPLGCHFDSNEVRMSVWSPTSQSVELLLFEHPRDGEAEVHLMERGGDGVWRACGPAWWQGRYYLYRIRSYHPLTGYVETCTAPDPYSRAVSADGQRTQVFDINNPECMPQGWDGCGAAKPLLEHHADAAIYELHVRDFSIMDRTVPEATRGKYLAFEAYSSGTCHLKSLAEAGLTHVHLLPTYDFGTVPERAEDRAPPLDYEWLRTMDPNSAEQQRLVMEKADWDGFNWGYDPVLFGVPEGSYATAEALDGEGRTLEFRRMVTAINKLGLRVVLDVVYNHLFSSGPHDSKSVYDKFAPGYFVRRSEDGQIENSTCMNNTASEFYMVDRLIVDDIVHWVKNYKVDGFRFDLMGHMMLSTLQRARAAIDDLTLEKDGVDGTKVILYGEGWEFGEVANRARGLNASQLNLKGTGIGSFNDRIREPALGGSPFADPRFQGFATGLYYMPWPYNTPGVDQGDDQQQLKTLLYESDKIRLGLAGNLAAYTLEDFNGCFVRGDVAHGGNIAYAAEPCETVNYVSAHDNETLFDMCVLKMPQGLRSTEDRMRASWLCTALVALGNGIPFFHAGDELLRSKSLDRDSYNSGDWFNRLDFTGETHNLGVGLPPASKNESKWQMMEPILSDLDMRPSRSQILWTTERMKELLRLRGSTPLLGLREAKEIMRRVRFPNSGPRQIPGLILMEVIDKGCTASDAAAHFDQMDQLCSKFSRVVVAFNARPEATRYKVDNAGNMCLHPLELLSIDPRVANASVDKGNSDLVIPPLSAVVFVECRQ